MTENGEDCHLYHPRLAPNLLLKTDDGKHTKGLARRVGLDRVLDREVGFVPRFAVGLVRWSRDAGR